MDRMALLFSETAKKQLKAMPPDLKQIFLKHFEKIQSMPPRRHMRHGIPHHVEKVTRQARIIYHHEGETTHIIRCFQNHKEYERWYKSYK